MKVAQPLTETRIRNLRPESSKKKMVADGNGLYIDVLPSGRKTWRLRRQDGGANTTVSLGAWPEVSLKEAREKARALRLDAGKANEMTIGELCEEWRKKHRSAVTEKEANRHAHFIDAYVVPAIGEVPVNALKPLTVLNKVLRPIEEMGYYETAHRVKGMLSRVFRYGVLLDVAERDLTQDLKGSLAPIRHSHRPTITSDAEVGRLMLAIKSYTGSPAVTYALRILPYVFTRPGELRRAEWDEIDLADKMWRIPAEKMKMRSPHMVPLSDQVAAMMARLREHTGGGRLLFPGSRSSAKPISDMAINAALRYLGYEQGEICGHGFRGMASTMLNERGYSPDWIERQLAHSERGGVRAAYNHAQWLPERRKMMQDWADLLDRLADNAFAARRG